MGGWPRTLPEDLLPFPHAGGGWPTPGWSCSIAASSSKYGHHMSVSLLHGDSLVPMAAASAVILAAQSVFHQTVETLFFSAYPQSLLAWIRGEPAKFEYCVFVFEKWSE